MFRKHYLSRAETKVWGMDAPIGDPTGGPAYGEKNDPVTAAIGGAAVLGGTSLIGGMMASDAASSAAQTQANATQQASQQLQQMYNQVSPYYKPYTDLGQQGVSSLSSMLPYLTQQQAVYKPATTADIMAQLPANYEFMKEQGLGAVRQGMNVGGGGSNMTRAATKFAEDYASNAYQNALQNYMSQQAQGFNQGQQQQTNIYNRLAGITNIGQQGVAGLSNLATGNASNIAQLGVQGANATAAGQVGSANAWQGALGNVGQIGGIGGLMGLKSLLA